EDLSDVLVGLWGFIHARIQELDLPLREPGVALGPGNRPFRLLAAHLATGAVARAVERGLVPAATDDEAVVTLAARDDAELALVRRRGSLSVDIHLASVPGLLPGE